MISLEPVDEALSISVADTGRGISEEALPRIFDPFYRADNGHSDKHAGLGLAIAKRIVELQQGHISVTSQSGVGSTFSFTLPLWRS